MICPGDGSIKDDDGDDEEAAKPGVPARYRQKTESSKTEIFIIIFCKWGKYHFSAVTQILTGDIPCQAKVQ